MLEVLESLICGEVFSSSKIFNHISSLSFLVERCPIQINISKLFELTLTKKHIYYFSKVCT